MIKSKKLLENAKKIAVFRTDRLGDMVLTLPMCRVLKQEFPDAEIIMIADSYTKPLLDESPAIHNVIFIDKINGSVSKILKNENIDVVFFPRPKFEEALAAFKAGIALRVDSAYRWYSVLFNHRVHDHRKVAQYHEAEYNVRLISSITGKNYNVELVKPFIHPDTKEKIKKLLIESKIPQGSKSLIIHPGSGGSANDWSSENFGKAALMIHERYNLPIIITGAESERDRCNIVARECPSALNLCGKLSLSELIALISMSSILVANSTGVLHIAAALGLGIVGLYPNTPHISARRWGPYTKKTVIINPPLGDDMSLIRVAEVVEGVGRLVEI